jgi:hypothetical protein
MRPVPVLNRAVYLFPAAAFVALFVAVPQLATAQTFQNCSEAEAAGRTDIPASDPAYDESLSLGRRLPGPLEVERSETTKCR